MSKKRGLSIPKVKCPNCRESFATSRGFNIHQAKSHMNRNRRYHSKDTAGNKIAHGYIRPW